MLWQQPARDIPALGIRVYLYPQRYIKNPSGFVTLLDSSHRCTCEPLGVGEILERVLLIAFLSRCQCRNPARIFRPSLEKACNRRTVILKKYVRPNKNIERHKCVEWALQIYKRTQSVTSCSTSIRLGQINFLADFVLTKLEKCRRVTCTAG